MTYDLEANAVMSFLNENHVGKKIICTIRINSYDFRVTFAGIMIVETPKKKKEIATNDVIDKYFQHLDYC